MPNDVRLGNACFESGRREAEAIKHESSEVQSVSDVGIKTTGTDFDGAEKIFEFNWHNWKQNDVKIGTVSLD
jgi:hypothetical protein